MRYCLFMIRCINIFLILFIIITTVRGNTSLYFKYQDTSKIIKDDFSPPQLKGSKNLSTIILSKFNIDTSKTHYFAISFFVLKNGKANNITIQCDELTVSIKKSISIFIHTELNWIPAYVLIKGRKSYIKCSQYYIIKDFEK